MGPDGIPQPQMPPRTVVQPVISRHRGDEDAVRRRVVVPTKDFRQEERDGRRFGTAGTAVASIVQRPRVPVGLAIRVQVPDQLLLERARQRVAVVSSLV